MRRRVGWGVAVAAAVAAIAVSATPAQTPAAETTALVGGLVIDGRGGPPLRDGVVVLRGGSIVAVGSRGHVAVPKDARVIDVSGRAVLPGLIESNGHITFSGQIDHAAYFAGEVDRYDEIGARHLKTALLQGITTLRDTHDPVSSVLRLRDSERRGTIDGARLFTAGAILNYESLLDIPTTRSLDPGQVARAREELDRFIATPEEGRAAVRELHRRGVDFIKISLSGGGPDEPRPVALSDAAVRAMVSEAHALHLKVTAHAMNRAALRRAVDLGFDAAEHPAFLIEKGVPVDLDASLARQMAARGVFSIPLLVAMETYITFAEHPERLDDPAVVALLSPTLVQEAREWAATERVTAGALDARRSFYAKVRDNLRTLIRAGAPIAMGTDKGTRLNYHEHANHVRELEIYVELGMTPLQALTSATRRGAELLGESARLGTLEAGKAADILVVDGDPSVRIRDVGNVAMVFKKGVRYR